MCLSVPPSPSLPLRGVLRILRFWNEVWRSQRLAALRSYEVQLWRWFLWPAALGSGKNACCWVPGPVSVSGGVFAVTPPLSVVLPAPEGTELHIPVCLDG